MTGIFPDLVNPSPNTERPSTLSNDGDIQMAVGDIAQIFDLFLIVVAP